MPSKKATGPASVYLIDTCIFVHAFCEGANGDPDTVEASRQLFSRIDANDAQAYISSVTIAELLSINYLRSDDPRKPKSGRRRNEERNKLIAWLDAHVDVVELDRSLALEAGGLGNEHLLKGADAIIYASAIEAGVQALVTTDKGLLKTDGADMRVVRPTQLGGQLVFR